MPLLCSAQQCDTLVWSLVAPVEYMSAYDLYGVKTYFFDAAKKVQKKEAIERLKKQYDSLTKISIGHVLRREVVNNNDETYADTWFWWLVKEKDKTYLNCFILASALKGAPKRSYYELQFENDTTTYRWVEPRNSTYNFSDVFLLLDGHMEVSEEQNNGEKHIVTANKSIRQKALTTPLHILTKYNGYGVDSDPENITYYRSLQFIFNKEEAAAILKTLQCMASK